ncbi:MAG: hypothetical protein QW275_00190, partial [Candidatus Anstonellaceae archaeon]
MFNPIAYFKECVRVLNVASKPRKKDFEKILQIGRAPNIVKLFPNSKALIVSGKFIDLAMLKKGSAICMAA